MKCSCHVIYFNLKYNNKNCKINIYINFAIFIILIWNILHDKKIYVYYYIYKKN